MQHRTLLLSVLVALSSTLYSLVLLDATQSALLRVKNWDKEIVNSIGMKLVLIPAGTFKMGSPREEADRRNDEAQHDVEITKEFYLGTYEVTQQHFKDVMGYNPSYFSKDGMGKTGEKYGWKPAGGKARVPADTSNFPVENVSWEEANEFCEKLTAKSSERGRKYRLPTEAEWEYSCRGGAPAYRVFHFGNSLCSKQANFDGVQPYGEANKGDCLKRTCKVGSYEKNNFGLFDMHGNVWEWCADWYGKDYYGKSTQKDPLGPMVGVSRVDRGGCWYSYGQDCRSASRDGYPPAIRYRHLGFRVALVPSGG